MNIPEIHLRDAVEALESLSDAAIRSGHTQTALQGYAAALRLRTEIQNAADIERYGHRAAWRESDAVT